MKPLAIPALFEINTPDIYCDVFSEIFARSYNVCSLRIYNFYVLIVYIMNTMNWISYDQALAYLSFSYFKFQFHRFDWAYTAQISICKCECN